MAGRVGLTGLVRWALVARFNLNTAGFVIVGMRYARIGKKWGASLQPGPPVSLPSIGAVNDRPFGKNLLLSRTAVVLRS